MKTLEKLVEQLENESNKETLDPKAQIEILREIGAKLINEYEIIVGEFTIQPLLVEAYYYTEKFQDDNSHNEPEQRNHYGKLYFHKRGRGGVDICLSKGEYALSFLLKCSYVNGIICKQISLYDTLKDSETTECVLSPKIPIHNDPIVFVPRKNVKETIFKEDEAKLAMVSLQALKYESVCQSLQKGKLWTVANYFAENEKEPSDKEIQEILGYRSQEIENIYEELRKNKR